MLEEIDGSVLLGGAQLCRGLSGVLEGEVFTSPQTWDDLPTFSLVLLFTNGCPGGDKSPSQTHGRADEILHFVLAEGQKGELQPRGWVSLKAAPKSSDLLASGEEAGAEAVFFQSQQERYPECSLSTELPSQQPNRGVSPRCTPLRQALRCHGQCLWPHKSFPALSPQCSGSKKPARVGTPDAAQPRMDGKVQSLRKPHGKPAY